MTKKTNHWMPLYVGDYLADTSRLNTEQHGAYLLLLMDYWRNGPPLDDAEELASITRLPLAQWRKIAPKILGFFQSVDGRLHQKRIDAEREKSGLIVGKRSASGKSGAEKRWSKSDDKTDGGNDASVQQTDGKPIANAMANAMENDGKPIANGMAKRWQNDGKCSAQPQPQNPLSIASDNGTPPPYPPNAASGPPKNGARAFPDSAESQSLSQSAAVCVGLKALGYGDTNPHDAQLAALLAAGLTADEILAVGQEFRGQGKGFRYLLGTAKGRRQDAANVKPLPARATTGSHSGFEAIDYRAGIGADGRF